MAGTCNGASVELKIPCRPEYVGVARLAILGVASRMKFSYDEVEDIRLAVGEACTIAVEWAQRNGKTDSCIDLKSMVSADKLEVDIYDHAGERNEKPAGEEDQEAENLGALLITLLVDEVVVNSHNEGTHVQMIKYAGER